MTVDISCAMCGKCLNEKHLGDLQGEDLDMALRDLVKRLIKNTGRGWQWQENGPNLDVYCSDKCAR